MLLSVWGMEASWHRESMRTLHIIFAFLKYTLFLFVSGFFLSISVCVRALISTGWGHVEIKDKGQELSLLTVGSRDQTDVGFLLQMTLPIELSCWSLHSVSK